MRVSPGMRRGVVLVTSMIAMLFISPAANAALTEIPYGGGVLRAGWTFRPQAYSTQLTGNIAAYTGAGSIGVCQSTWDWDVWVAREGCAVNHVGNALNLMPYYGNLLQPGIKNNSPWNHTIHGWYYVGTP